MSKAKEQALKNHTIIGLDFREIERLKEEFLAGYNQAEQDLMEKVKQWFTEYIADKSVQLLWSEFEQFIAEN